MSSKISEIRRRIIGMLFIALLMLSLCACRNGDGTVQANEDAFLVQFHIDCEADVHAVHFEYYLNGIPVGGGGFGNANNSKIAATDVYTKDFNVEDFPEDADISLFQLEIFVVDQAGNEYSCNRILDIAAEYGKSYEISITGSRRDGFSADQL